MQSKQKMFRLISFFVILLLAGSEEIPKFNKSDLLSSPNLQKLGAEDGITFRAIPETNLARVLLPIINCTETGLTCVDCTNVAYCLKITETIWYSDYVWTCSDDAPCLQSTGNCSSEYNPICTPTIAEYNFVCNQVGLFPDPYDITVYHMCIPNYTDPSGSVQQESIRLICDPGFAYNSLTKHCNIKNDGSLKPISPNCSLVGDSGGIQQNPNLFYLCLRSKFSDATEPVILSCPNDQEFDDASKSCKVPNNASPDFGIDTNGRCNKAGNYPVPDDCTSFNYCIAAKFYPFQRYCLAKYFDPTLQKCVDFECPDIK